jgi:FkbM family methyltransferase
MEYQRWKLNPKPVHRLSKYLKGDEIETVIDAGANVGQFASELRFFGYNGRIVSLEPSKPIFEILNKRVKKDKIQNWEALNIGISDENGPSALNVSGNSGLSSSILEMKNIHKKSFPESAYIDIEQIQVVTLQAIVDDLRITPSKSVLKLDLQGLEGRVLSSCPDLIAAFAYIYFESSIECLYEGEQSFSKLVAG